MMIHPTADISPHATIGRETQIWNHAQVREGAVVGAECVIGRDVYIDAAVEIGSRVKIQNSALLYRGAKIADGVFIGPRVCLTNDRYPRAITPDGMLKREADWEQGEIHIAYGASIGAGAVVVTGVHIGAFAMVGAGAVVTQDVPDHGLVLGVPARLVGYVCLCGKPVTEQSATGQVDAGPVANAEVTLPRNGTHRHQIAPSTASSTPSSTAPSTLSSTPSSTLSSSLAIAATSKPMLCQACLHAQHAHSAELGSIVKQEKAA